MFASNSRPHLRELSRALHGPRFSEEGIFGAPPPRGSSLQQNQKQPDTSFCILKGLFNSVTRAASCKELIALASSFIVTSFFWRVMHPNSIVVSLPFQVSLYLEGFTRAKTYPLPAETKEEIEAALNMLWTSLEDSFILSPLGRF